MQAIFILLVFQLSGELCVQLLHLPLSGNIMGMLLLFAFLTAYGRVPESLSFFCSKFLQHLALYLLPVSAGVMTLWPLLQREGVPIIAVMVASTLVPLVLCAWLLDKWLQRRQVH